MSRGLRYGWWKRPPFLLTVFVGIPGLALYLFLFGQWFEVWGS